MNCLNCQAPLPESAFPKEQLDLNVKKDRFACPHCRAEHVRRRIGTLPSGEPLFSLRLWGHLTSMRRKS